MRLADPKCARAAGLVGYLGWFIWSAYAGDRFSRNRGDKYGDNRLLMSVTSDQSVKCCASMHDIKFRQTKLCSPRTRAWTIRPALQIGYRLRESTPTPRGRNPDIHACRCD